MSLVERDGELERVRSAIAAARDSGGVVIAVSGEPGAGKSSLLREALDGVVAHWGWCEPGLTPRPLGAFRDALRSGALGDAPIPEDPAEALLTAMEEPLVLVIEDAQWIDDASARVLRFLGRRLAATRGVILVSYRDNIGPDHPLREVLADLATSPVLTRIELGPLSPDGVAALLEGSGRDASLAHQVTGGNAFLVSALRDAPEEDLSASVRDLAWSWARRLEPSALDLLKTVVVVPGRIPLEDLRDHGADLDALVLAGLLRLEDRSWTFRHELVRRALDADLTPDERLRAHEAAYRRLQVRADAEPSELAFHALHAGLSAEALAHERQAATQAIASAAHSQAVEHYRRVVELAEGRLEDHDLARVCVALAGEEYTIGHDADARRYAAQAAALVRDSDDPLLIGQTLLARSRISLSESERVVFAEQAAAVLEAIGDGPELAEACAHASSRRMVARDLETAETWGRRALAMIDEDEHPEVAVVALQALGSALTLGGRDDTCVYLRRAVDVGLRAGLDQELGLAYTNFVSAAGEARLYDVVAGLEQEALAFFADRDLDGLSTYTEAWLGRCAFEQGHWDRAATWVEGVIDARDRSSDIALAVAFTVRGRIAVRRGEPEAAALLDEAQGLANSLDALQRLGPVAVARAEAAWLAGGTAAATDLEATLERADSTATRGYRAELTFWLRRLGADPVGLDDAPSPWEPWLAGRYLEAAQAWADLGCTYEEADALAGSDDEDDLRRALELIDKLGAAPLRARTVRRMRALGVRSIPRGPRRETAGDAWGLTAREQEVLGWLRQGSTDADIAVGLHLSIKTVGHHVSAILRKTGSQSRRELWGSAAPPH